VLARGDFVFMLRSRLFWKLYLATASLAVLAVAAFGAVLSNRIKNETDEQVLRRLRESANLLRGQLVDDWTPQQSEELQRRVRDYGEQTGTRFTLIAADGTVIADSTQATLTDVEQMANHGDRPEVVRARTHGIGLSSHVSKTMDAAYRYFALRVDNNGETLGYVRTALPEAEIYAQAATARKWIRTLVALASLLLAATLFAFLSWLLHPLSSLTEAADAIAAGDYEYRIYGAGRDELGMLARTFDRISRDLHGRMTQLSQTGDRQSIVLGGMIEGVIAVDNRNRIALANNAAGRLFGFQPVQAEGRPLLEVVRNHALQEAVAKSIATNEPQRLETRSSTPSTQSPASARQHLDIHIQPLPGQPCPGVVLVMHDTTELRRLESLRREFMANVSHELKTPLSSIKAYTETLRDGALRDPDTAQRFLSHIEEQSERLHRLIMDMLMLARIESDQQPFEIVPVNVADVAKECVEAYRPAAVAKGIDLALQPDAPGCRVRADREGLREILDNLVDNAIKYTPEGGRVTVGWREQRGTKSEERRTASEERVNMSSQSPASSPQRPTPSVCLYVRDTGIGIKAKDQPRVFERFYRVDKARSRELGGTGLGLAIVKHLAQSFGGTVNVTSEPGQGSTFTIELPAG
jgi:two-component system phosphate regulon sensor histidine kinase PhoR